MRGETDPGTIASFASCTDDTFLFEQDLGQLPDVQLTGSKRHHRPRALGIGVGPELYLVDFPQLLHECLADLPGAILDVLAANFDLKVDRSAEGSHRPVITLPETFEALRYSGGARKGAVNAGPDLRLRSFIDVQDTCLFGAARPLVGAPRVKVGLNIAEIDIQQPERLGSIDEGQDLALARQPA